MAPVSQADHDVVESESCAPHIVYVIAKLTQIQEQLKDVIQDLYQLMVQVNSYDLAGRPSRDVLEMTM